MSYKVQARLPGKQEWVDVLTLGGAQRHRTAAVAMARVVARRGRIQGLAPEKVQVLKVGKADPPQLIWESSRSK